MVTFVVTCAVTCGNLFSGSKWLMKYHIVKFYTNNKVLWWGFCSFFAFHQVIVWVQLISPISTSLAKQCGHGVIFFCSLSGILCVKRKTFHRDVIISSSRWSSALYEPRYLMTSLDVANIGMSVSIQTSMAKWFFGAGRFTRSPSSNRSKLFHSINSLVQRKSLSQMIPFLSAPTQAYLSDARVRKGVE